MGKIIHILDADEYQVLFDVRITNGDYININEEDKEIFNDGNVSCHLRSGIEGLPIKKSDKLLFVLGDFSDEESAKDRALKFGASLRYYLSARRFTYTFKWRIYKKGTAEVIIECSANLSILRPFQFEEELPFPKEHFDEALKILESAENIQDTPVRFCLYLVVMEAILDPKESTVLKDETELIDLIDKTIAFVDENSKGNCKTKKAGFQIKEMLEGLKKVGSRNAVKKKLEEYFRDKQTECAGKQRTYINIYNDAYNYRNRFLHDGTVQEEITVYLESVRTIAYDVAKAYAKSNH